MSPLQLTFPLLFLLLNLALEASARCKCIPGDACWPSMGDWSNLNASVSGKLIATVPIALSCYPGPDQDAAACAAVDAQWSNVTFQSASPIGLSYPPQLACPPVNVSAGAVAGTCTIGDLPRYAVNATKAEDVAATISFAKEHNLRLVIKDTGHDLLGRSSGFGSLEIWIRYLRTGITFQNQFKSTQRCKATNWTGPSFTIGGGYTWSDVYPEAQRRGVVVVGGGTPSVGCLGGWAQGGGHGPASHQYGLGADQILEAIVVLANGSIVTASPCTYPDLLFAIRGGGGGTYGVVVSTSIKAHPSTNVVTQHLAMAALSTNISGLFDGIETVWSSYPDLNDAGYSGYGQWAVDFPVPLFSTINTGFVHGISIFGKSLADAEAAFEPTLKKLLPLNGTSLFVSVSYVQYSDYWTFYQHESGVEIPIGYPGVVGSRLFDRLALTGDGLRGMLEKISGRPGQGLSNNFELVSGGQVFKDASDPYSGVNPAWRTSYMNNIIGLIIPPNANASLTAAIHHDMTYTKVTAMKAQAPGTGAYMNEADRFDPEYEQDFYGLHFKRLSSIKEAYDPLGLFYCPTCVGSEMWKVSSNGSLCQA